MYQHLKKNSLTLFTLTLIVKSSAVEKFTLLSTILP